MPIRSTLLPLLALFLTVSTMESQQKRTIAPSDCVTVRYLKSGFDHAITISPQGDRVAYLVTVPDLESNRNRVHLYVKPLADSGATDAQLLKAANDISQIHWSGDGRSLIALVKDNGHDDIENLNATGGYSQVLIADPRGIDEFTLDATASTIVYSIKPDDRSPNTGSTANDRARGYRVQFERPVASVFGRHQLFLTKRADDGRWSKPVLISIRSPFSRREIDAFSAVSTLKLSLSPDGRQLLFSYLVSDPIPTEWQRSPYVSNMTTSTGFTISVLVLKDLSTGASSIPLATPEPWNIPLWSTDSSSFVVVSAPPVGSAWERQDYARAPNSYGPGHLFFVRPGSGDVEEVTSQLANVSEQPLAWDRGGQLVVHTAINTITSFAHAGNSWQKLDTIDLPLPQRFPYGQLAADGTHVVGEYQATAVPPELFLYTEPTRRLSTLEKLDPQFSQLMMGQVRHIHWAIPDGPTVNGLLLLPPDYVDGKRYPLVIQTKPEFGQFLCDSGQDHYPAFAPEPIADAGMLYLIRSLPSSDADRDDVAHYPKAYPGKIGEAAFHMQMWDAAVEFLSARGMIDPNKVGIIGFSRAGWYTEFILMNSRTHYAAATAADNVQYSLGEYWMDHSVGILRGFDAMYGGSPYGSALPNWEKYSISFNLNKISTPLLIEVMGEGIPFSYEKSPPLKLASSFEVFAGLNRLAKPVELYYYPNEMHEMDHPQALLGSLERNLAWYRRWLQGIVKPTNADSAH